MSKIVNIHAREVLDSRGNPTVEVEVTTNRGVMDSFIVPSGASTGSKEALELRDNDPTRYLGKGVLKAVSNINGFLSSIIVGIEVSNQYEIDLKLLAADGTKNKSKYGANAILGISMACLKTAAKEKGMFLYEYLGYKKMVTPMMNVINGGAHAANNLDFQEYMLVPVKNVKVADKIRMSSEVFHTLKDILKSEGYVTSVGDEGGFAPLFKNNEEPLEYIVKAILKCGYKINEDFKIALDVAASEFYDKDTKLYKLRDGNYTSKELIAYLKKLTDNYPIMSIEDGLAEDDYEGWQELSKELSNIMLVGDDLFVTNKDILAKCLPLNIANSILIKPNQIGTYTEMVETIELAKKNNYRIIMSHRSGDSEDVTIADLAVCYADFIKTGSLCRSERTSKYNELIRIEERTSLIENDN